MRLKIQLDGGQLRWTMVRSLEQPEPLADGTRTYTDVHACYRAAVEFSRVPATATRPTEQPDGRWRWIATGEDGQPLAQSSAAFPSVAACGYALHALRHDLAVPPGATDRGHQEPGGPR